jgi:hypothetical protein
VSLHSIEMSSSPAIERSLAARAKRVQAVKGARAQAQSVRDALRDKVCVAPRYTKGPPEAYRYVVTESCVHKDAANGPRRRGAISVAQTKKEVRILKEALGDGPIIDHDVAGNVLETSHQLFALMIRPKFRLETSNPLERYDKITSALREVALLPRRFILNLVRLHLESMLPPTTTKNRIRSGAPPTSPTSAR